MAKEPEKQPRLIVVAGPNGAGKSTMAGSILESMGVRTYINVDLIAAGLGWEVSAIAAGRVTLARLDHLGQAKEDFGFETTLAARSYAKWISQLQNEKGYTFHLVFVYLDNVDLAIQRVVHRVRLEHTTSRKRIFAGGISARLA